MQAIEALEPVLPPYRMFSSGGVLRFRFPWGSVVWKLPSNVPVGMDCTMIEWGNHQELEQTIFINPVSLTQITDPATASSDTRSWMSIQPVLEESTAGINIPRYLGDRARPMDSIAGNGAVYCGYVNAYWAAACYAQYMLGMYGYGARTNLFDAWEDGLIPEPFGPKSNFSLSSAYQYASSRPGYDMWLAQDAHTNYPESTVADPYLNSSISTNLQAASLFQLDDADQAGMRVFQRLIYNLCLEIYLLYCSGRVYSSNILSNSKPVFGCSVVSDDDYIGAQKSRLAVAALAVGTVALGAGAIKLNRSMKLKATRLGLMNDKITWDLCSMDPNSAQYNSALSQATKLVRKNNRQISWINALVGAPYIGIARNAIGSMASPTVTTKDLYEKLWG